MFEKGGVYYAGVIAACNGDGAFASGYDDSDRERAAEARVELPGVRVAPPLASSCAGEGSDAGADGLRRWWPRGRT